MAHVSGNSAWTNTAATPITAVQLEGIEDVADEHDLQLAGDWGPADLNYIGWAFDPLLCNNASAINPVVGTLMQVAIKVSNTASCTGVSYGIGTAGTSLVNCYLGLWDSTGTLVAQSIDKTPVWQVVGSPYLSPWTSPVIVNPGLYYAGFLVNGSGALPKFLGQNPSPGPYQQGHTVNNPRFAFTNSTGLTAMPATRPTPSTLSIPVWAALY